MQPIYLKFADLSATFYFVIAINQYNYRPLIVNKHCFITWTVFFVAFNLLIYFFKIVDIIINTLVKILFSKMIRVSVEIFKLSNIHRIKKLLTPKALREIKISFQQSSDARSIIFFLNFSSCIGHCRFFNPVIAEMLSRGLLSLAASQIRFLNFVRQ